MFPFNGVTFPFRTIGIKIVFIAKKGFFTYKEFALVFQCMTKEIEMQESTSTKRTIETIREISGKTIQ